MKKHIRYNRPSPGTAPKEIGDWLEPKKRRKSRKQLFRLLKEKIYRETNRLLELARKRGFD